jgi:Rod binding domain-containing protein
LGVQSLSTSMAASGGLGIGKMIAKAMHAAADREKAGGAALVAPGSPSGAKVAARNK